MAKRFTASDKWQDKWFRRLDAKYKLLWIYLLDNCTPAGIWEVDLELAGYFTGFEYQLKETEIIFKDRIHQFEDKWFVPKFILFQYGQLSLDCKPHLSVINELKKYRLYEGYTKGIHTLMDKDKDKDKDKDRGIVKGEREPSIEDVIEYFESNSYPKELAENFYSYYAAQNWETKSGVNIKKRWQAKVIGFINNQKNYNYGTDKRKAPRGSIDFNKYAEERAASKSEDA